MEESASKSSGVGRLIGSSMSFMRKCLFRVLSVGPIPGHIAVILDGNRRYARKWNLGEGMGHHAGFLSLMSLLKYCYELGVKYVTIYAFSIDNYKRRPEEVKGVMDLMQEKIEGLLREQSVVRQYGVRVYFIGNLDLLSDPVKRAAKDAMRATAANSRSILMICAPYTSTDEILHAALESCQDKASQISGPLNSAAAAQNGEVNDHGEETRDIIKLSDVERRMYMSVAPDPDILVRSSGETRLSNFLLWQTTNCLLYSPKALWPEIGLRHLVWAVLNFQRSYPFFENRKKLL
ncbi:dehydrodolichyl diphosphate synthase CPT3-like [Andrographis paniculata]|uniref:dehydrodolichyl diphosphate synthase CPT3-like n=1 Tax=Andrographis paniculata TaxID=175694 RepID=UPI0021E99109|nr:dehydrodolichyl diphosphate synthase CPT3-like [Andrographis paniculata]